jgi:hypothetical protein
MPGTLEPAAPAIPPLKKFLARITPTIAVFQPDVTTA